MRGAGAGSRRSSRRPGTGTPTGGATLIQLPIFLTVGVSAVSGGTYSSTTHTVTANAGATTIAITLAN